MVTPAFLSDIYLNASLGGWAVFSAQESLAIDTALRQASALPDAGSALAALGVLSSGFVVAGVFSRIKEAWIARFGEKSPAAEPPPLSRPPSVPYRALPVSEEDASELQTQWRILRSGADHSVRQRSGLILAETFEGRTLLIEALKDENSSVRLIAAESLRETSDSRVVKPLLAVLLKDPLGAVRGRALAALSDYRHEPEVVEGLVFTLRNKRFRYSDGETISNHHFGERAEKFYEAGNREEAARLLGETGGGQAVEALIAVLSHEAEWCSVTVQALASLGNIGGEGAERSIREFLSRLEMNPPILSYIAEEARQAVARIRERSQANAGNRHI